MDTKNTEALQVLTLMDGRFEGDEQISILCGPVLTGITQLAYCDLAIRLYFDSKESLAEAKRQTGWELYDDTSLLMLGFNDQIYTREPSHNDGTDRTVVYYGDWYIKAAV